MLHNAYIVFLSNLEPHILSWMIICGAGASPKSIFIHVCFVANHVLLQPDPCFLFECNHGPLPYRLGASHSMKRRTEELWHPVRYLLLSVIDSLWHCLLTASLCHRIFLLLFETLVTYIVFTFYIPVYLHDIHKLCNISVYIYKVYISVCCWYLLPPCVQCLAYSQTWLKEPVSVETSIVDGKTHGFSQNSLQPIHWQ